MAETWNLVPLEAVGPLMLGMTEVEVEALSGLLGARYALDRTTLPSGRVVFKESRDLEAPIVTFQDGLVSEILIDHHSRFDVRFGHVSVFQDRAVELLAALERADGTALWGLGGVVFPNLSVGTMNFLVDISPMGEKLFWEDAPDKPPRTLTLAGAEEYASFLDRYVEVSFL